MNDRTSIPVKSPAHSEPSKLAQVGTGRKRAEVALPAQGAPPSPRDQLEADIVAKYRKQQSQHTVPAFKATADGDAVLDHVDREKAALLLAAALGSLPPAVLNGLVNQLRAACYDRQLHVNASRLNLVIGIIAGIKPRDVLETLLAAQAALVQAAVVE